MKTFNQVHEAMRECGIYGDVKVPFKDKFLDYSIYVSLVGVDIFYKSLKERETSPR